MTNASLEFAIKAIQNEARKDLLETIKRLQEALRMYREEHADVMFCIDERLGGIATSTDHRCDLCEKADIALNERRL